MKQIQWYPGHMAKGLRMLGENIKITDLFVIVIDARIPNSSFNPNIEELTKDRNKGIVILLNKSDLADKKETDKWLAYYKEKYEHSYAVNLKERKDVEFIKKEMLKILNSQKKNSKRVMVLGIPNVGKSTLINSLANKKIVKEQNQPGITKTVAWSNLGKGLRILDSPGILMPAYDSKELSLNLAFTNNIKLSIVPIENVSFELIKFLKNNHLDYLNAYYKDTFTKDQDEAEIVEIIAKKRGMVKKGIIDYNTLGFTIVRHFADGKMGPITLEKK